MREYYTVVVEKGWSYIIGPNGYREGPIRYEWEAQEWADEMNAQMVDEQTPQEDTA